MQSNHDIPFTASNLSVIDPTKMIPSHQISKGSHSVLYAVKLADTASTLYAVKFFTFKEHKNKYQFELDVFNRLKQTHPNIIQCHGNGYMTTNIPSLPTASSESPLPFLFLEFCAEGTLSQYISDEDPASWDMIYRMATQLASALAHLHDNKIIHCDLKSENILLDENQNLKICDFSLSVVQNESQAKVTRGSYFNCAPEVLNPQIGNSSASDVYSLFTILCEIISWQNIEALYPEKYKESNATFLLARINGLSPTIDEARAKECSPQLLALIKFGLSNNPSERPSAREVATKFELKKF